MYSLGKSIYLHTLEVENTTHTHPIWHPLLLFLNLNLAFNDLNVFWSKHVNKIKLYKDVAQMAERLLCIREARGSIPCTSKANYLLYLNLKNFPFFLLYINLFLNNRQSEFSSVHPQPLLLNQFAFNHEQGFLSYFTCIGKFTSIINL